MTGKAKPTKHTAAEIKKKTQLATQNAGAGSAGKQDRAGGAAGHSKFKCPVCAAQMPSLKNAEEHWENKHHKMGAFDGAAWQDTHAVHGGTTSGVGVRGGQNVKHK